MASDFGAPRVYRSDDRDLPGEDRELVIFSGGNGDWYVQIRERGDRLGPTVRVTTSGAPSGQQHVGLAIYRAWRAMGGEPIEASLAPMTAPTTEQLSLFQELP